MASRAICLPLMSGVVENDVMTFQGRKIFNDSVFRVFMTNRADGVFIIRKLRRMTARTGKMSDKFRRGGIVFAFVAERTRKTRMFGVFMVKF